MADSKGGRTVLFISKATPGDDEFAIWLAPRLEAAGYNIFADILALQAGDNWRNVLTEVLQAKAVKMLLCCRDATLSAAGVQEELSIAADLSKGLKDPNFIIPLRLEPYRKIFGVANLHYVNFEKGWAQGLETLLDMLRRQNVPSDTSIQINPHWEAFRRRNAIALEQRPERLTSNWLRVSEMPDIIRYFEPTGAVNRFHLNEACENSRFPMKAQGQGVLSFGSLNDINKSLEAHGRFKVIEEFSLVEFREKGVAKIGLSSQDASNSVAAMMRGAWERYCIDKGLLKYKYSKYPGFHVTAAQARLNQRIPWGRQGDHRSSALRNTAKGHVWQYGITAIPHWWPFPHYRLKSRVLFAPPLNNDAGDPYDEPRKQHRLRRSVCKGWRNKQWQGRLLAYLELLSGDNALLKLPFSETVFLTAEAAPILFTSPVSTVLPNKLDDDQDEADESTLGRPEPEDET